MIADAGSLRRRALLGAALFAPFAGRVVAAEESTTRIRFDFADQSFTATLQDNPSVRDLMSMLPLDIKIEDYARNEKIAYLPRRLSEEGSGPFKNEAPGDLCYYAPWGNLAMFHAGYRYSTGLIRLGRIEGSIPPLLMRGEFPLRIDRIS